ncbi:hypothetical protein Tco_1479983 [Tanacetum coccineum]
MINGILHEGRWITDPNDIKLAFLKFYKDKFSCHDSAVIFPSIIAGKCLCDFERNYLDSMVSLEEIKAAVWDCGSQKAPGPDGFSLCLSRSTGCSFSSLPFSYLGLPIGSNMGRIENWNVLIGRFKARLSRVES